MATELQRATEMVILRHGGVQAAARVLQVDAGYISRLRSGKKDNPSPEIMRKLGLRRRVVFEWIEPRRKIAKLESVQE